jgi:hypothetical protein
LMNFNRIGTRDLIEMQKYLAPIWILWEMVTVILIIL